MELSIAISDNFGKIAVERDKENMEMGIKKL